MRLYVDDQPQYTTYTSSIITLKNLSPGAHKVGIVAWTNGGGIFTAKFFIGGAGGGGGCVPNIPGVQFCSPPANATVTSPVQLSVGARATNGFITAMRTYVDGREVNLQYNSSPQRFQSISVAIPIPSGDHYVAVVAYQSNSSALVTTMLFHVR